MRTKHGDQTRRDILKSIITLRAETGLPPTWREIAGETRLSTSGVDYELRTLRDEGLVSYVPHLPRTLTITDEGRRFLASG